MFPRILPVFFVIYAAKCTLRTDQQFWTELAENELAEALQVKWNLGVAKNVILFVGDGMGPNTVTATRIYKGGESHRLVYEKFPHVGLLKTYSANKMVPDSSCSATALFCGVKANQETIGVDASVKHKDCSASLRPEARLKSLASIALKAGKSAGFVTTMRVTHATPGPIYAHSADRKWECEDKMPASAAACKDIARQLVEDWPGKDLQVILGGGRQVLVSNSTGTKEDPLDTWSCIRKDGKDLIKEYQKDKHDRGLRYSYVSNNKQLKGFDVDQTDYLLGIFANGHLKYEHERNKGPEGMPSISDMVEAAIKVLRKNKNGYFLMVEGGNVDMAHHRGWAKRAIDESAALEGAVRLAAAHTDPRDTLLVVTSDHTHTLSINGYPYRGTDIFDIAQTSKYDNVNYTTLSYGTGGPGSMKYSVKTEHNRTVAAREDPGVNTDSFDYQQIAAITLDENSHGGGDVVVYARGPHAHLFHNVHEQHYVYHAISYAAKMGAYSGTSAIYTNISLLAIAAWVAICIMK
ncbi:alkaline phosphatase [Bombyx mori]|uniref:Alkaline phosphatase n=1 Tax=Bombyx mori TaxID=7091 RepID=A0A8R1WNI9_BOMMO|nr:alkaline phosphatase isoform X2 [Bombyx mori]